MVEPVDLLGILGIIMEIIGFVLMIFWWKTNPTATQLRNWELGHHRALHGPPDSWILIDNRKELGPKAGPDSVRTVHQGFVNYWRLKTKTLPFGLVITGLGLQLILIFLD